MRCTPAETKSVGRNGRCSFPLQTNDSESRYVPCQRRGEEDGGGADDGEEDAAGRGDTPKKRLIVYAEECCEHNPSERARGVALPRGVAQPARSPTPRDTASESEKKKRVVMEMSPLKSLHLSMPEVFPSLVL